VSASRAPIEVLVVGAGIAGTAATLAAAKAGARVHVLDGGPGASSLATGAIDLHHWRDGAASTGEIPLFARDVLGALDAFVLPPGGSTLLTTAGVIRAALGHDAALLDLSPFAAQCVAVVRCARPGWDADALASAAGAAWIALEARVLHHADERALVDADFAARHDDEARLAWLADRLREALATAPAGSRVAALLLPPSLGVDRPRAQALSQRVGVPCGEPVAMPGGPSGFRFERARDRALAAAGVTRAPERVVRVERGERAWRVTTTGGADLEALAVVLATGGLLGGGLEYAPFGPVLEAPAPPRAHAPVRLTVDAPLSVGAHGRSLEAPGTLFGAAPEDIAWPSAPDGLLERAGILADEEGRCLRAPPGLYAAGEIVADATHTWVRALLSGARAGAAAAAFARVASDAPSPDRGPPSRP
jgi:glycerol-3-phosphate dehydrogenase subunit B